MAEHNDFGKEAEQQALDYLITQGYTILERNFVYQHAEIDIIALKNNILVIIEVKARRTSYFGEPESFVNPQKIKLIVKATDYYIQKNDIDYEVRFDIISIVKNPSENKLLHLEDAFYAF